jgi:hypothetical protein
MNWILLGLGIVLILVGTIDFLGATMGIGGGVLGRRVTRAIWSPAIWLEERFGGGARLLRQWGILVNLFMLIMWISLILVGWAFVFSAWGPAVVDPRTQHPVDIITRVQFTVSTLTGLGRGLARAGSPDAWKVITLFASLGGTFVISFAISFLIPIIQAATAKRTLGHRISLLGKSPIDILNTYCGQEDAENFHRQLEQLLDTMIDIYEKHRTYPTLHFLFSHHPSDNMALNLVVLDETITIFRGAFPELYEPPPRVFEPARLMLTKTLEDLGDVYAAKGDDSDLAKLINLDILIEGAECTVDEESYQEYVNSDEIRERRRKLSTLLKNNGWSWQHVYNQDRDETQSSKDSSLDREN